MTLQVGFESIEGPINDRIDDAYRAKYHDSAYLGPMISARARAATVQVSPRDASDKPGLAELNARPDATGP
jgi:hypothetical protein